MGFKFYCAVLIIFLIESMKEFYMSEERTILKASCQYNDYVGNVVADAPMKLEAEIFQVEGGHKVIGWTVGKYGYDSPIRVKLLYVDENDISDEVLVPDARIKTKELEMTADEFINSLGRFEVLLVNQLHKKFIGEEFLFEHED